MSNFLYNDSELQMDSKLILLIEERDKRNEIDTRLFISWCNIDNDYFVRGKRCDNDTKTFVPYAFHCDNEDDLYDFIEFVVGLRKTTSVVLYNFNNTEGILTDELNYEFFEENIDKNYEIAGYDNVKLKRHMITKYLRMLKNMYNWDNTNIKNKCNT